MRSVYPLCEIRMHFSAKFSKALGSVGVFLRLSFGERGRVNIALCAGFVSGRTRAVQGREPVGRQWWAGALRIVPDLV
jgi:hypothetical protein